MNIALQILAFEYLADKMLQVDMIFAVLLTVYRTNLGTCPLIHHDTLGL